MQQLTRSRRNFYEIGEAKKTKQKMLPVYQLSRYQLNNQFGSDCFD
jgi:hypothetical protein